MNEFQLPQYSARLLSWLLNDDWGTGLGDFQEYYGSIAEERGARAAAWHFRGQVIRMLPGRLLEKSLQGLLMFRNYVLLGVRHFRKHRVASTINIFGLSVALACCVTVFLFLDGYTNLNSHHQNAARTYSIEQLILQNEETQIWGTSPMPLGPAVVAEESSIERSVRLSAASGTVYTEEESFEEWVTFAEDGFFQVFDFPMASGSSGTHADGQSVILSDGTAKRFFGDEEPVGQQFTLELADGQTIGLTVGAVAERFPASAGIRFNVLVNLDRLIAEEHSDWTEDARATFLLMREGANLASVNRTLERWIDVHNSADLDEPIVSFRLENLLTPSSDAWKVRGRFSEATHPVFVLMLLAIPLFMLALSCFNYVNISLGSANTRLREIGIRKVVGGSRRQLVFQFMAENLVLCAFAMVVGLTLAFVFLIPLFNSVFVNQIVFSVDELSGLIGFLAVLLVVVGVLSGAYPAFFVTSFQPVQVLRGRMGLGSTKWLTNTLLTAQFALAFLTVIISLYLTMNGRYMVGQDWGYDPEGLVSVRVGSPSEAAAVADHARRIAGVSDVTTSVDHLGVAEDRLELVVNGEEMAAFHYRTGSDYLKTVGLSLHDGRGFGSEFGGDRESSIVVNEAFARSVGWERPLEESVRIDGENRAVVGVVDDFLVQLALSDVPVVFSASDGAKARFVVIRFSDVSSARVVESLRSAWEVSFPDQLFEYEYQPEILDQRFESYQNVVQAFSYLAALALAIACLGLFGLASQNIARRLKEVSVRKVLGASIGHLTLIVNSRFAVMLTIAGVVATVVVVGAFGVLMSMVEIKIQHLPLRPGLFLTAYLVVLATAAVAVGSQARTLIRSEPAQVLRND